jgi:peptide/nickel transport system permease protein
MIKPFKPKMINIQFSSQWGLIRYKFSKHRVALVSLYILIFIYIIGFFCELIAPYDPASIFSSYIYAPPQVIHIYGEEGFSRPFVYGYRAEIDRTTLQRLYVPDYDKVFYIKFLVHGEPYKLWGLFKSDIHLFGVDKDEYLFLFGTDRMGRDMMSRIICGTRISTSIGLLGVFFSFVLGTLMGGLSGFYGGMVDNAIQRLTEFLRSIPTIPLWLGLAAAMPASWSSAHVYFMIVIILSFIGWTGLARVVRSKFMSLRNEDFVMAAKLAGASDKRIILRHLVPSFSSHIIASLTLAIPEMIISETALSFLGLGIRPPIVSWGVLLQEAQNIRTVAMSPWLLIPAVAVIITVFCFNFLGDGLRDAADPYSGQGRL